MLRVLSQCYDEPCIFEPTLVYPNQSRQYFYICIPTCVRIGLYSFQAPTSSSGAPCGYLHNPPYHRTSPNTTTDIQKSRKRATTAWDGKVVVMVWMKSLPSHYNNCKCSTKKMKCRSRPLLSSSASRSEPPSRQESQGSNGSSFNGGGDSAVAEEASLSNARRTRPPKLQRRLFPSSSSSSQVDKVVLRAVPL